MIATLNEWDVIYAVCICCMGWASDGRGDGMEWNGKFGMDYIRGEKFTCIYD